MNKHGYYTKHFNIGKNPILTFDANSEVEDTHYTANKICNVVGYQIVEEREHMDDYNFTYNDSYFVKNIKTYFDTMLYSFYNIDGKRVKNVFVKFDFDNSTITINNKTVKVVECTDFVYKVMKTKIKAIDGIKGFYKHILECMHIESPFNASMYNVLCKIGDITE